MKMDKNVGGGVNTALLPQYKNVKWKRLCEKWVSIKQLYLILRLYYRHLQIKMGIDIPIHTQIGEGFLIEHCGGIVINPKVSIGRNCNIYNGVTIGKEKRGIREGNPVIGNPARIIQRENAKEGYIKNLV